ncbi:MAG TPA: chloride channel protein [Streptosporangiaceae bacterium]|nr:chloride channel protein [Streptosporangiaceae bacterium]
MLRSRAYVRLLVVAAVLGAPISAVAWGFLALVSKLEHWLYVSFPDDLGFTSVPVWWPFPLLAVGGILVALSIKYLPGTGGHSPADGFKAGGVFPPRELAGIALAALATLGFGAVLGPEAPLIALGGGLAAWAVSRAKAAKSAPQVKMVVGAAGSFAAISSLLGSPLTGAFLMMEVVGFGGATLELILLPGLLASGIGALIFLGLGEWSGLGDFSLSIAGLPHFARPDAAELGWALVIGLAASLLSIAIRRLALVLRAVVQRQPLLLTPLAGVVVAAAAVLFNQVTGKGADDVLFSGQNQIGPFVTHAATYGVGALVLLVALKALAYLVSLSGFRGGPTFPAIFVGAVGGALLSHLPGLPLVPAVGMGMGAMAAGMLRLPLTSVLVASLVLLSDGIAIMPVVIVAVVTAYVAATWLDPPAESAGSSPASAPAPAPAPEPSSS